MSNANPSGYFFCDVVSCSDVVASTEESPSGVVSCVLDSVSGDVSSAVVSCVVVSGGVVSGGVVSGGVVSGVVFSSDSYVLDDIGYEVINASVR